MEAADPRWLTASEQKSWRALVMGMTLLLDRLDADLRRRRRSDEKRQRAQRAEEPDDPHRQR